MSGLQGRALLALLIYLGAGLGTCTPEEYSIPQAGGSCLAKVQRSGRIRFAEQFPVNDTTDDIQPVQLHFWLFNTGWAPVQTPFTVSIANTGYLDAYDHEGFTLATEVDYGVVTLLSKGPEQQLLPHAGSVVEVRATVEVTGLDPSPTSIFLDDRPCTIQAADAVGIVLQPEVQQSLTTRDGQIIGLDGQVIDLKGIAWFGFEDGNTVVDGLWEPEVDVDLDGLSMELQTAVQRMQLLGFNAIRLPFTFDQLYNAAPKNYTLECEHPDLTQVVESLIPPYLDISVTNDSVKHIADGQLQAPYRLVEGTCNPWLPNSSVLDRFLFVINYLARNGFYIVVVHQTSYEPITVNNQASFVQQWQKLLSQLSEDPATRLRLLIDPINELDTLYIRWENNQTTGLLGQGQLYLDIFEALHKINPYVLFFVQGTGQKTEGLVANWGDGLATSAALLKALPLSDPNPFFQALMKQTYLNQVVIAPHVYPPTVTAAEEGGTTFGQALYKRLSDSFGYLNKEGYCMGTTCHRFPVVVGETGSGFDSLQDIDFMEDLALYLHNIEQGYDRRHNRIGSWFLWAWNANAALNLGLLEADWQTIKWRYVEYMEYLGLEPWYLKPQEQRISQVGDSVADVVTEPQPIITIPAPPPPLPCPDVAPDATYTCTEQKKFGKCDASFLLDKGYCAATCNRCWSYQYPPPAPPCADIAPDPIFTCEQQASFGKCNEDWMAAGGYCAASCSRCSHPFTIDGRGSANGPGLAPSGAPAFPAAEAGAGFPLVPDAAPAGQGAPDVHAGVATTSASDVTQAQLTAGSGGGVDLTASTSQDVDPSVASVG